MRGNLQNQDEKPKAIKANGRNWLTFPQKAVIAVTTQRFLPFTGPETTHRPEPAVLKNERLLKAAGLNVFDVFFKRF